MTVDNRCNICNSDSYDIYLRFKDKNTNIVRCGFCRTLRTMPYPDIDYSEKEIYCEHYLRNEALYRRFANIVVNIIARHKGGGRLLDIGCSVGFILEEASKVGFESEGIELNQKAVDITVSKKLNVKKCNIEEAGYGNNIFDAVVLNHILEHILKPGELIQKVKNVIKQKGVLIVGVPNHNSLVANLIRTKWYGWGIPEHTWHFDKASLENLLLNNGFRIREMIQNSQYYPFSKSLRKNFIGVIARIGNKVGAGDQLIAVAEKV